MLNRLKSQARVPELTPGTRTRFGPLEGGVKFLAADAVENRLPPFGVEQRAVAIVVKQPKAHHDTKGAERVNECTDAEGNREHRRF